MNCRHPVLSKQDDELEGHIYCLLTELSNIVRILNNDYQLAQVLFTV